MEGETDRGENIRKKKKGQQHYQKLYHYHRRL